MFDSKSSSIPFNCSSVSPSLFKSLTDAGFAAVQYDAEPGVFLAKSITFQKPPKRVAELCDGKYSTNLYFELSEAGILHVLNEQGEFESLYLQNDDFWELLQSINIERPQDMRLSA